jgi:hypothetical protein
VCVCARLILFFADRAERWRQVLHRLIIYEYYCTVLVANANKKKKELLVGLDQFMLI